MGKLTVPLNNRQNMNIVHFSCQPVIDGGTSVVSMEMPIGTMSLGADYCDAK